MFIFIISPNSTYQTFPTKGKLLSVTCKPMPFFWFLYLKKIRYTIMIMIKPYLYIGICICMYHICAIIKCAPLYLWSTATYTLQFYTGLGLQVVCNLNSFIPKLLCNNSAAQHWNRVGNERCEQKPTVLNIIY